MKLITEFQQKIEKIASKSQKDRIASAGEPAQLSTAGILSGGGGALTTIAEEPGTEVSTKSKMIFQIINDSWLSSVNLFCIFL